MKMDKKLNKSQNNYRNHKNVIAILIRFIALNNRI